MRFQQMLVGSLIGLSVFDSRNAFISVPICVQAVKIIVNTGLLEQMRSHCQRNCQ
jgi:hypothetical protein